MSPVKTALQFPAGDDPWSVEQATALLCIIEDIFHRIDVDALVRGFTEDCVLRIHRIALGGSFLSLAPSGLCVYSSFPGKASQLS